ncbi:hypothetical protein SNEBB_010586 [Seison nebaliae]|nr:hypothetical protein SNEBB_010586 [Seison nebaliae]
MFDTSSNTDGEEDAMISKQIRSLVSLNRYRPKSEVMIDESDENYLHRRHLTESFDQDSHHSPPSPSVVNRKNNKKFSHSII